MQIELYVLIPIAVGLAALSFVFGWYLNKRSGKNKIDSAESRAQAIISEAEKDANNIKKEKLLEVKDEWYKKKQEFEHEVNGKRNKLQAFEKQLAAREDNLERKVEMMNKKD